MDTVWDTVQEQARAAEAKQKAKAQKKGDCTFAIAAAGRYSIIKIVIRVMIDGR